jgi:hypothetical protein
LTKDLPAYGRNLHKIYDVDVNQYIDIARSAGPFAYHPDITLPLETSSSSSSANTSSGVSRPTTVNNSAVNHVSTRGNNQRTSGRGQQSSKARISIGSGGKGKKKDHVMNQADETGERDEGEVARLAKYRRSASIAAPENMYRRICCLRPAMQRNIQVFMFFIYLVVKYIYI